MIEPGSMVLQGSNSAAALLPLNLMKNVELINNLKEGLKDSNFTLHS